MGLFASLQLRAHETIKSMCKAETVDLADVRARIGRDAKRFTDIVSNPNTAMSLAEPTAETGDLDPFVFVTADLLGMGDPPSASLHGLRINPYRRAKSGMLYCVNRRNMLLGLGDGEFWYDRASKRVYMSVRYAFDVSRASPGLKMRVTGTTGY